MNITVLVFDNGLNSDKLICEGYSSSSISEFDSYRRRVCIMILCKLLHTSNQYLSIIFDDPDMFWDNSQINVYIDISGNIFIPRNAGEMKNYIISSIFAKLYEDYSK